MKKTSKSEVVLPETIVDHIGGSGFQHLDARSPVLLLPAPTIIETIYFTKVGHTFKKLPPDIFPDSPTMYAVQDFLLAQTGTSGSDGKMSASKSFDLTTAVSYRFNVLPKDRMKRIYVKPPASGLVNFSLNVGRRFVNAASDYLDQYVSNSYFLNLVGPTPVLSYNSFFIGHNTNHWIQFQVLADVAAPISFSGFTTYGKYPSRSFDPGTKSYVPYSTSVPFNLPSSAGVPHLMFGYTTDNPVDPGPFVSTSSRIGVSQ